MGITEDITFIKDKIRKQELEEESRKKKWSYKLPFGKKVGKTQKKKNYVTVQVLYENGQIDYKKIPIEDQTIMHDTIPRLATAGYVMHYKNNPMIIVPNWSVEPISPLEHYNKSLLNGSNTKGYKILMAAMLKSQVDSKPKMGNLLKWIVGLGLAGIIAYAFITGGGN